MKDYSDAATKARHDAFKAYLKAIDHRIAYQVGDEGFAELYIISYQPSHAIFYVHSLIDCGTEVASITHFESMAAAVGYVTQQAVHTFIHGCELAAYGERTDDWRKPAANESALEVAIAKHLTDCVAHREEMTRERYEKSKAALADAIKEIAAE